MTDSYRYRLTFTSGDNFTLDVQWLNEADEPVDLTEMAEWLEWIIDTDDHFVAATIEDYLTVDISTGTIHLVLPAEVTAEFEPRSYGRHVLKVYGSFQETIVRGAAYVR